MKMWLIRIVAVLAIAALAWPVAAKPVSKKINVVQSAKIGKANISAGEYRLLIDGTQVTIKKGNRVVAEVEGRWEQRETKYMYDSYLVNRNGQLEEVRFAGSDRALVLLNR